MTDDRTRELVELMRRSLSAYEEARVTLATLVSDLGTLIDSLDELADKDWVAELRSMWWQLEVVNALALLAQRHDLTDEEQLAVNKAVDALVAATTSY